ncbi:MAG: LysR family transcriptional regulator [Geminicoccaceae bacterium]
MAYTDNIKSFVRIFELGSLSAAARDQRTSPAVVSSRLSQLEDHLGIRLFLRTTRSLQPTEQGRIFYDGAKRVLEAIADAEAAVADVSRMPRGTLAVAAPFSVGRRFIAPEVPDFKAAYPLVDVRLRMSDRHVDLVTEGLDVAFTLGTPADSALRQRVFADCQRILCAAPSYIARCGNPRDGEALVKDRHDCLILRFPGAREFQWTLVTAEGPVRFAISGPFDSDDGDVLTAWALGGHGIVLKPVFEIADDLRAGRLVPVATATPPEAAPVACVYAHRRHQDPKTRLFIDFMAGRIKKAIERAVAGIQLPR